jgi:hypothetical protein
MSLTSGAVGKTFSISADEQMTKYGSVGWGDWMSYRIDRRTDLNIKIKTGQFFSD